MLIKQKSIRSVDRFLKVLLPSNKVRLVVEISDGNKALAQKAGFTNSPGTGDTLLPTDVGNITRFNSEGKYKPLKDLPKEERYLYTVEWTWTQWRGRDQTEEVTEYRDVFKECYQQQFIAPPSLEITWVENGDSAFIVSEIFNIGSIKADLFKHAINLFLELFGECEIRRDDLSTFTPPIVKKIHWEILPPGRYPWDKVQSHVKKMVKEKNSRFSSVILDRQETISRYEPDEVYQGKGGFLSYLAYVFKDKKLVILESVLSGNATYVFDENWEQFSALTKAEILDGAYQRDRLIHSKGWENRLQALLDPEGMLIS
jgi:hypothetical protein